MRYIEIIGQTRTQKLTLRDLNRLKLMQARDKIEALKRQDLLAAMYGAPEDPDDEKDRLDIERKRLDIDRKRLDIEAKELEVSTASAKQVSSVASQYARRKLAR